MAQLLQEATASRSKSHSLSLLDLCKTPTGTSPTNNKKQLITRSTALSSPASHPLLPAGLHSHLPRIFVDDVARPSVRVPGRVHAHFVDHRRGAGLASVQHAHREIPCLHRRPVLGLMLPALAALDAVRLDINDKDLLFSLASRDSFIAIAANSRFSSLLP